jgi:hypothetical protein
MKTFRDYLQETEKKKDDEPSKPKPTKEKDDDWSGLDNLFTPQQDQPLAKRDEPEPERDQEAEPENPAAPDRPRASQRDTQRATGNIHNPRMQDLLGRMRDIENDPDDPGYPEPENPDVPAIRVDNGNLPAVAGRELAAGGVENPDWHQVANLPGNMQRAIRTLGRHLFASMTTTPTNDIWMVANLGGQGPNTSREVNAVAAWVRENGTDLGDGNIDFDTTIPGYNADIRQFSAGGIRWLLVRDEFGNYIYSWPEHDSVDGQNRREIGNDRPAPGRNAQRRIGR